MKKLNNYKRIWLILMMLSPFFSLVKAQTCDPNILKALEQTRVSVFDKVTKGETGSLTIQYPMDGVTYTFTDQAGTSYSYTHSGTATSKNVDVGVVNTERKFALKAVMGDCVYQTSFIYKLTPVTTLGIAVRVEHEWCNSAGALNYKIVGGDSSKYNFFHRKSGSNYSSQASPDQAATSLEAGTYDIKAEPKTGSGAPAVAPITGIQIQSLKQTIDYSLVTLPAKCPTDNPSIQVNVTSGSYPLTFELYKADGTTPVPGFPAQASNIFTNVPPGSYKVKVRDFCAGSTGTTITKDITITNDKITFTKTILSTVQEFSCNYTSFFKLGVEGSNQLEQAYNTKSFYFPFSIKFALKAPSGTVHNVEYTFNNANDLELYMGLLPRTDNQLIVRDNLERERIPREEGTWEATATITTCGGSQTLPPVTADFVNPLKDLQLYIGSSSSPTACHSQSINMFVKNNRKNMSLSLYVVIDEAPANFDYEGAGFYKITSVPSLANKYVKQVTYNYINNDGIQIIAPDYLNQHDHFKFRLVDAQCDNSRSSDTIPITITNPTNNEQSNVWFLVGEGCRGVTATGVTSGTVLLDKRAGREITEVKITNYIGTETLPFTLPYNAPAANHISLNRWALYDLPKGKYTIVIKNACGATETKPIEIKGETYSFNWSEDCTPQLSATINNEVSYDSHTVLYYVQHFNTDTNTWDTVGGAFPIGNGAVKPQIRTFTTPELKKGKFRILRKIKVGDYGRTCEQVISEKEYKVDLEDPVAMGAGCSGNLFHVAIIPKGGKPPYKYELVSKKPHGSSTPIPIGIVQTGDNFFVDISEADLNMNYTFSVEDACQNKKTVSTTLGNLAKPTITVSGGEFHCVGQQATLSLPNLSPNITVKWYRGSTLVGTGHSLNVTLTAADFLTTNPYKVVLEWPAKQNIANCVADAIVPYQFKEKNYTQPTLPTPKNITVCVNPNDSVNLTSLFENIPTNLGGGSATIREKSGVLVVPTSNTIAVRDLEGDYTFVYELWNPCLQAVSSVEATLTIKPKKDPKTKLQLKVCNPTITIEELESLVLRDSPEVRALNPQFHWFQTESDAQGNVNVLTAGYSFTLSSTNTSVYVRYTKEGYCFKEPYITITVEKQTTVTPKALTNADCAIVTAKDLKALIDNTDKENVIIYKNGDPIADDALIDEYSPTMYTYTKRLYQCTPAPVALTFNYKERTPATPKRVAVCTYRGYAYYTDVLAKLQGMYTGKVIKVYENGSLLSSGTLYVGTRGTVYTFTVEESGKCPSFPQLINLQQDITSAARPLSLSICEDTTIAELTTQIQAQGYSNVKIYDTSYSYSVEVASDKLIIWGKPYYYRAEESGKCPSEFMPLNLVKIGNKTNATPKLYEVCIPQGNTAKIADLKSVISGGEVKIFKRNNDNTWSDPLDDNTTANENDAYFYTLRETGKCPSDKTAISLVISYKTTTPTATIADPTWCSGKKVSDLKTYIASKGVTGTIKIYESATATTDLADATVLEKNKSYHFTTHDGNPQHCESNRVALTITIYASPAITTHPVTPSPLCGGTTTTALSVVATGDDISYQWYKNTTNDNTSGTAIAGKTSATFDPPTDTVGTTYYYVKVSSGKGCTAAVSNTAKVVVTKPTKITRQPSNIRHCMGTLPPPNRLEVEAEGTGTLTYQWYLKNNNYPLGTAVPNVPGNTGQDAFYNPPIDSAHTTTYYVEVTSDCGTVTSNEIVVDIIPYPSFKSGGNLTTNDDATYCKGATSVRKLKVDVQQGAGSPVYQWYKATSPMGIGQEIDRAWSNEYTPDVTEAGTFYYYVTVRNQQYCTEELTSYKAKIVVNETTAIEDDLSETEVKYCKGATATALTVKMKGTPNYTYTWYKASNMTETGTVVRTQTSATAVQDSYTPATADEGTFYYYVKVSSSCGNDKTSKRAKITIQSLPAITMQPATLSKPCKDSTLTLSIAHTGDGNRSVQWYRNTTNSNTGGTAISGETANTFTVPTGTVGTTYYYAVVSSDTGCTPAVSSVAEVIVQSLPAITTQPAALSKLCKGASLTLTIAHSGDGNRSVQWYRNTTNSSIGGTAISGETASTFTVPTSTVGTTYYYAVVSSDTGCTPAVSNVAEVVVTEPTAIDTNLSTTEKKYCKDQTSGVLDLLIKAKGTAPFTYKWHKVDAATSVDTVVRTENTNSDEDSYTPVVTTLGTAYYYVEVSSACGSDVTSARAHITVTENTAIDTDLSTAEVKYCKGATANALLVKAKGTPPFEYKWHKVDAATSIDTVVRTEANSLVAQDTYTPETTTVGSSYYYVEIHSDCGTDVTSARAKITVTKPTAITTNLSTTEVKYCKDEPSPATLNVVAEGTGTLTYQWYKAADATSAGTQIAGQTTATLAASAIEVATRGTTYYYVVVHSDCGTDVNSDRAKITITDPDTPIVDATQTFCNTATIADLRPNDSDIKWYASPTGGAPLTDGTRALAHGNKYYAARTLGSCESPRAEVTVNITTLTTPVVTEISTPACGQANVLTITTGFDTDATYTFVKEDDTTVSGGSVEGANHKITGLAPGKYKVKATKGACNLFSGVFEVKAAFIIPAKPEITLTPASCTSPTVAKLTNQASGLTYWHNGTQLTVNPITHEIKDLAPGTYTITAKNNNNCESVASDSFEIKAQQTATTITTAPAGATYQKGDEATPLAVVATGEGTLSYKWYKNTDNNNTSGTEVGDNSPSYKPATDRVGTFYYWVEVTSNCGAKKSTVAEIKVVEGAPTIEANDDPDTTVRRGQEVAVLGNDKVNGNPATPADVDITISNDGGLTRVGVNPATGKIMIPNDAAPATYEITYKICVKNQPTICDEAKVKITVEVPTLALKAVDDDFGKIPNAVDYTTTNTVFSTGVDTMEGVVGNLSPERDVVLTPGAQPHENITMNPNGSITVKRGTPKGTYTYEYTICQKDVPTNCDKAKVSFEVIEAHIFAKDDGVWEVGTEGALTPSVLNNDILGERVGIAPSEVSISKTQGKAVVDKTLMEMNEDGRISVKKNIPEGTYTYYYTITENANTANTSSASVTIRVVSFSAQDDEFDITNDKTKEFKTESVLKNDELNKKKNPSPVDDVILTKGEAKDAERNPTNALTMNEDGTITIAPNTPDGVYTYTYTICKTSAPTECKSAEAVIKLLPALIANDDDFTANPINPLVKEGIAGNVLDNDRYADGNALEHLDKIEITMLEDKGSRANIEPNGNVVIPQGAPAGEYTLKYNLCMKDHPTICAEAKVKIVILEDKPIVIHNGISANGDGVNDGFMIEHIEGYPKNNLKIFNRWGVLVYEKDGYTNSEPFDGHSNGRATISADSKLPQGTYYYILEYQDTAEQTHTKKGWLYLKY